MLQFLAGIVVGVVLTVVYQAYCWWLDNGNGGSYED